MTADIYDETLSLQLAGGNHELAIQMLELLCKGLPEQKAAINTALEHGDMPALYQQVHKVTGSTRYCGVPALADAAEVLDRQLKNGDTTKLDMLVSNLNEEIDQLIALKS
jgi:two-component system sensor histidine kinase BarA